MTTEKNIRISFRNKFEKLLNNENRQNIMSVFQEFCRLEHDEASKFLWRLTFGTEEYRSKQLNKLGLLQGMIPDESLPAFKNELRHQYEKLYPNALTAIVPETCKKAFDALTGSTDSIVATVVYKRCQKYDGDTERVLYFLQSDLENLYSGGIGELGFYGFEREYLKPFRMKIHDLLKALCDYRQENDNSCDDGNKPFANLGNIIREAGIELADGAQEDTQEEETSQEVLDEVQQPQEETDKETPAEEAIQTSSEYKPLTSEEVLYHKEVFEHFVSSGDLNALLGIGRLGFDLNVVTAKKKEIGKLLQAKATWAKANSWWIEASGAMKAAEDNLHKADAAMEEANRNLSKMAEMFDGKE